MSLRYLRRVCCLDFLEEALSTQKTSRSRARPRVAWLVTSGLLLSACGGESEQSPQPPATKSVSGETGEAAAQKLPNLPERSLAELRALASSGTSEAQEELRLLLSGSDSERLFGAFGLGVSCETRARPEIQTALLASVARAAAETAKPNHEILRTSGWALGVCGLPGSEDVLRSWLTPDANAKVQGLLEAGVLGLSALADRKGTLSERTQTSLLDAAAREERAELLLPLGRVGRLSDAVGAHILEVAGALLTRKSTAEQDRRPAIFALGSAGPSAAAPLGQVLLQDTYSPGERSAAAQALSRLGVEGQLTLDGTLAELLERGLPLTFDRPLWIPLRAGLDALTQPDKARAELKKLTSIVLPEGTTQKHQAQRRRLIWLRCRAAELLADARSEDPALLACDPDKGRVFQLAQLNVLGRKPLTARRDRDYRKYLESADPVVAQAALRMLPAHSEISAPEEILLSALTSKLPGTQATALQVIAAYPARVVPKGKETPSDALISAVSALLTSEKSPSTAEHSQVPLETRAAALRVAGALGALSLKPPVEEICKHGPAPLRLPAAQALSLLGSPKANCDEAPAKHADPEKAPTQSNDPGSKNSETWPVTLVVDSDVGQLLLHVDGRFAPESAARVLELVDSGFYNMQKVHVARPGFAVQFGDPDGDGYDNQFSPPLPRELSPQPFDALSIGMSEFSPGAQSHQLFVLASDAPQLTGTRVHLGHGEGPWHLLTVGDELHSIKRSSRPSTVHNQQAP